MKRHNCASEEQGSATAEYTVGTIGAIFIASWLIRHTIGDPANLNWYADFIRGLIERAFNIGSRMSSDNWMWSWLM